MIFPVAQCIEVLSQGFTLLPGDVIAPHPGGRGGASGRFLKAGDKMEARCRHRGPPQTAWWPEVDAPMSFRHARGVHGVRRRHDGRTLLTVCEACGQMLAVRYDEARVAGLADEGGAAPAARRDVPLSAAHALDDVRSRDPREGRHARS